jgi:uncharacterized protein YbaR (Trm112 family)
MGEGTLEMAQIAEDVAHVWLAGSARQRKEEFMTLPADLLEILVCPKCKDELEYKTEPKEELVCNKCRLIYAVEDGIPIMLIDEATTF